MSHGPSEESSSKTPLVCHATTGKTMVPVLRIFALGMVMFCGSFLFNNYLSNWWDLPGFMGLAQDPAKAGIEGMIARFCYGQGFESEWGNGELYNQVATSDTHLG